MATTIITGSTSNRLRFLLGVTGLTNSTTGLIISTITDNEATATVYTAAASNIETITTLGTYAAPTASKCRFREVDATNHPGLYEIQLADARFSVSNASRLAVSVVGAAGLPSSGVHYEVDLKADADVKTWRGTQPNILQSGRVDAYAGAFVSGAIPDTESIADAVWDEATSGHTISGTYGGRVLRSTSSNVTVAVTGSNHVAADVHEFQTDVFDADAIAASAVTELQSGLATSTQLTTVEGKIDTIDNFVDTEVAAIKAKTDQLNFTIAGQVDANALTGGGGGGLDAAGVRAAVGLASANLDTQLAAIDDFLDTEIAAIKAKTDQLAFTVPNQVDANALTGGGGGGLTQAQVRQAVGLASANLDAQLAGIESDTNSIIASLSGAAVTLVSPVTDLGALVVFNGRTYGGSAHAAIQFTVAKNYTAATYVELVLFTLGDPSTELQTLAATVASSTSVTVSGTINATGEYSGEVAVLVAGYTLQASWGGSMETIATGKAYIYKQPS